MIDFVLQDENGRVIKRPSPDIAFRLSWLPEPSDRRFTCLRFVDPWGDTVFNVYQAKALLEDLNQLTAGSSDQDLLRAVDEIRELAKLCEQHLYLRFIGD